MSPLDLKVQKDTPAAVIWLAHLLDVLHQAGVRTFKAKLVDALGDVEIHFAGDAPYAELTAPLPAGFAAAEPEKCACGHSVLDHNASGECLLGCTPGACVAKEEPKHP